MSGKNVAYIYLGNGRGSLENAVVDLSGLTMYATSRAPSMFGANTLLVAVLSLTSFTVNVIVTATNVFLSTDMVSGVSSIATLETSCVMQISTSIVGIGGSIKSGRISLTNASHMALVSRGYLGSLVLDLFSLTLVSAPIIAVFVTASMISNALNLIYENVQLNITNSTLETSFNTTVKRNSQVTNVVGVVCVPIALMLLAVNCSTCSVHIADSSVLVTTVTIQNPGQNVILTGRLVGGLVMGFDTHTMYTILNDISSNPIANSDLTNTLGLLMPMTRIVTTDTSVTITNVNVTIVNPIEPTSKNGPLDTPVLVAALILPPTSYRARYDVRATNLSVVDPPAAKSSTGSSSSSNIVSIDRSPVLVTSLVAYADTTVISGVTAILRDIVLTSPYASIMTAFGLVSNQRVTIQDSSSVSAIGITVNSQDPHGVRLRAINDFFSALRSMAIPTGASAVFINSSSIFVVGGSQIVVANSTFTGLVSLTPSARSIVADAGGADATAARALQFHVDSRLVLGCNLWEGAAMPSGRHLLDAVGGPSMIDLIPHIVSPARALLGPLGSSTMRFGDVECRGPLETFSVTPSAALPNHPDHQVKSSSSAPAVSVAVMAAGGVASLAALSVSLGGLVGFPLAQSISSLGRLQERCLQQLWADNVGPSSLSSDASSSDTPPFTGMDENPLQIPWLSVGEETVTGSAAGAVIGNTVLVLAVTAVIFVCRLVAHHLRRAARSSHDGAMMLGTFVDSDGGPRKGQPAEPAFYEAAASAVKATLLELPLPPGSAVLAYLILQQPTMSAAMSLLADGYSAGSVILGVVGAAAVLGFTMHLVVVVAVQDIVRRQFTSIPATLHDTRRRRGDSAAATLANLVAWLTVPMEQWKRQRLRGSDVEVRANQVAERYGVVFTTYRHDCLWFAAVDLGMGVLCGAIAGGAQVDSDPCSAVILSGWLLAAISFLFVPAVLYFRPYACRQDAGLGIVSAAITVISSVGAATNAIDNNSNFALSLLCIALQLLPLIMTLVRVPVARCTGASELMVSRWWKRSLLPGEALDAALEKNSGRSVANLDVLLELSHSSSLRSARSDSEKVLFSLVRLICERHRRKEKVVQS